MNLKIVWRNALPWAVLFAGAFIARTALDWRVPTSDFHNRATISTLIAAGLLLSAGVWNGARSTSFRSGAIIGLAIAALALPMQLLGAAALLAVWHDPSTLDTIRTSGGIGEVFSMPFITVLPAVVLGAFGGMVGVLVRRLSGGAPLT